VKRNDSLWLIVAEPKQAKPFETHPESVIEEDDNPKLKALGHYSVQSLS
jgi:hypothetical protein